MKNEFDCEEKYKLYRTVREILHPTISKRNISNYKIILEDGLNPLRVFYPKKVSNLSKVIIFVHGDGRVSSCEGKYGEISSSLSKELEELVISIDYLEEEFFSKFQKIYDTFLSIYSGLMNEGIQSDNIVLMSDSTASVIVSRMIENMGRDNIEIGKLVLFYPVLSGKYYGKSKYSSIFENLSFDSELMDRLAKYYKDHPKRDIFPLKRRGVISYPKTLVLVGGVDPLVDEAVSFSSKYENVSLCVIPFASHGFLGSSDKEIKREYLDACFSFLQNNS